MRTVSIDPALTSGSIATTITGSATENDPQPANNTNEAEPQTTSAYRGGATPRAGLDLGITKTASVASVVYGGSFKYTVVIHNHGGDVLASDGAQVIDVLPDSIELTAVPAGCSYVDATRTLTCLVGALASGQEYKLDLPVRVTVFNGTQVINKAIVDLPGDGNLSNNESTAAVGLWAQPVPALSATGAGLLILLLALTALPYRRKHALAK
jgi:uncharacterized repeat protein (TIGR01451 family)